MTKYGVTLGESFVMTCQMTRTRGSRATHLENGQQIQVTRLSINYHRNRTLLELAVIIDDHQKWYATTVIP
jgi:hypothetical protein